MHFCSLFLSSNLIPKYSDSISLPKTRISQSVFISSYETLFTQKRVHNPLISKFSPHCSLFNSSSLIHPQTNSVQVLKNKYCRELFGKFYRESPWDGVPCDPRGRDTLSSIQMSPLIAFRRLWYPSIHISQASMMLLIRLDQHQWWQPTSSALASSTPC